MSGGYSAGHSHVTNVCIQMRKVFKDRTNTLEQPNGVTPMPHDLGAEDEIFILITTGVCDEF